MLLRGPVLVSTRYSNACESRSMGLDGTDIFFVLGIRNSDFAVWVVESGDVLRRSDLLL